MKKIDPLIEFTEKFFRELLFSIDSEFDDYQLAVIKNDEFWEHPLPDWVKGARMPGGGPEVIVIAIKGWTREESYFDEEEDGMFLKVAFGDDENTAFVPTNDVMGILNSSGQLVYAKTYSIESSTGKKEKLPSGVTEDGISASMEALLKNNPQLKMNTKKEVSDV